MKDEEILRAIVAAIILAGTHDHKYPVDESLEIAGAIKKAREIIEAAK